MIMNVFFISSMSTKFERVFSETKHTINDERISLKSNSIEILKCCKTWFKIEIFTEEAINVVMIENFEDEKTIEIQNEQNDEKNWKNEE